MTNDSLCCALRVAVTQARESRASIASILGLPFLHGVRRSLRCEHEKPLTSERQRFEMCDSTNRLGDGTGRRALALNPEVPTQPR